MQYKKISFVLIFINLFWYLLKANKFQLVIKEALDYWPIIAWIHFTCIFLSNWAARYIPLSKLQIRSDKIGKPYS